MFLRRRTAETVPDWRRGLPALAGFRPATNIGRHPPQPSICPWRPGDEPGRKCLSGRNSRLSRASARSVAHWASAPSHRATGATALRPLWAYPKRTTHPTSRKTEPPLFSIRYPQLPPQFTRPPMRTAHGSARVHWASASTIRSSIRHSRLQRKLVGSLACRAVLSAHRADGALAHWAVSAPPLRPAKGFVFWRRIGYTRANSSTVPHPLRVFSPRALFRPLDVAPLRRAPST